MLYKKRVAKIQVQAWIVTTQKGTTGVPKIPLQFMKREKEKGGWKGRAIYTAQVRRGTSAAGGAKGELTSEAAGFNISSTFVHLSLPHPKQDMTLRSVWFLTLGSILLT